MHCIGYLMICAMYIARLNIKGSVLLKLPIKQSKRFLFCFFFVYSYIELLDCNNRNHTQVYIVVRTFQSLNWRDMLLWRMPHFFRFFIFAIYIFITQLLYIYIAMVIHCSIFDSSNPLKCEHIMIQINSKYVI